MSVIPARNQNSVQVSLAELRQLHIDRVVTAKEAQERERLEAELARLEAERTRESEARAAEERRMAAKNERERMRIAAEHDLELAREKARLDAEARVQEKKLEIELKRADAEALKARAMMPQKRRWLPFLAMFALVLGLQGALFLQQSRMNERARRSERSLAAVHEANRTMARTMDTFETSLEHADDAAKRAQEHAAALEKTIETMSRSGRPSATTTRSRERSRERNRDRHRDRERDNGQVLLDKDCTDKPLGCITN